MAKRQLWRVVASRRTIQATHPHHCRNLPEAKAESSEMDSGNLGCDAEQNHLSTTQRLQSRLSIGLW